MTLHEIANKLWMHGEREAFTALVKHINDWNTAMKEVRLLGSLVTKLTGEREEETTT